MGIRPGLGELAGRQLVQTLAAAPAMAPRPSLSSEVAMTDDLSRKQREFDQSLLAKSQFVARMSHEIRTPMSGVIGMLDVLHRAETDQTKRAHIAIALKSARDLLSVLDGIVDISLLESRHLSLDVEVFSLGAVVEDVVGLFGSRARDRSLVLKVDINPSVPGWVQGDPRRVRQVLSNLVGNALKFTESGGVGICVSYNEDQQMAFFRVNDTGIGIGEKDISKLFEHFSVASSTATQRQGGSGLGLAISKQLVKMMGGEIGVESEPGLGSTFYFSINAPTATHPKSEPNNQNAVLSKSLRILIAEDNPAMQEILRALLEGEGHQLTIVSDGRDAVAMAAGMTFDVALMDVMMPTMDGPTATQRIRELGGRSGGIPIIALTANALVGDRDRYISAGMTDCLSKPIDVAALFAALGRVIAES